MASAYKSVTVVEPEEAGGEEKRQEIRKIRKLQARTHSGQVVQINVTLAQPTTEG